MDITSRSIIWMSTVTGFLGQVWYLMYIFLIFFLTFILMLKLCEIKVERKAKIRNLCIAWSDMYNVHPKSFLKSICAIAAPSG